MVSSLRVARLVTFAYFGLNGFVLSIWVVHIPTIERGVDVSHAVLGWLLLLLGLGAFVGMRLAGPIVDRLGARRVVPWCAAACGAAVVLPAFAVDAWTLGAALLAMGLGNGGLDVSMNAHAVAVEARYRRPVMSAFHAVFSVGGFIAALFGARTLAWGWSPAVTLSVVGGLAVVAGVVCAPGLLPRPLASVASGARAEGFESGRTVGSVGTRRAASRRMWLLAGLAMMLMMSEGIAYDWSVLATREAFDVSPALAALAYAAFAAAMTVGRFLADWVAARVGAVAIVRYGSALAGLSMAVIVLSPGVTLVIISWALFGLGLSGTIPQLFSAAGHSDPQAAGSNVSRVVGLGYLGVLAGPAVIGPLTHLVSLNHAFVLPMGLCVWAAFAASVVRLERDDPGDGAVGVGLSVVRSAEGER